MKAPRTFLLLSVVVAVLLMAIAYAAITNVNLNITGNVAATADQGNFKVAFTGTPTYKVLSGTSTAKATMTASGQTATMNVSGMKTVGDSIKITYYVKNSSTDIDALISSTLTNSNSEYFSVQCTMYDPYYDDYCDPMTLLAGQETTISITVRLIKTPMEDVTSKVTVKLTAQPGYIGS